MLRIVWIIWTFQRSMARLSEPNYPVSWKAVLLKRSGRMTTSGEKIESQTDFDVFMFSTLDFDQLYSSTLVFPICLISSFQMKFSGSVGVPWRFGLLAVLVLALEFVLVSATPRGDGPPAPGRWGAPLAGRWLSLTSVASPGAALILLVLGLVFV